jgi:hypothetical protein
MTQFYLFKKFLEGLGFELRTLQLQRSALMLEPNFQSEGSLKEKKGVDVKPLRRLRCRR